LLMDKVYKYVRPLPPAHIARPGVNRAICGVALASPARFEFIDEPPPWQRGNPEDVCAECEAVRQAEDEERTRQNRQVMETLKRMEAERVARAVSK
jgi:hypothetical protein